MIITEHRTFYRKYGLGTSSPTDLIKFIIFKKDNGAYHRECDKPALVEYFFNGLIKAEYYYINGNLHRDGDKPALIEYYQKGGIKQEVYYINGKVLREGVEPSYIKYYSDGSVRYKKFLVGGTLHNTKDASYIRYKNNPIHHICFKEYRYNGELHNLECAAIQHFNDNVNDTFAINGEKISEEEWLSRTMGLKFKLI